jgi:hypothetical protein
MEVGPQTFYKLATEQLETQTLLLKGEDLSQLLQSLIDRIKELETKPLCGISPPQNGLLEDLQNPSDGTVIV